MKFQALKLNCAGAQGQGLHYGPSESQVKTLAEGTLNPKPRNGTCLRVEGLRI